MEKTFAPIFIKISDVARVPEGTYKRGSIKNITFENVTATDCYSYFKEREMPSLIWGKPETPIENISFKNVSITAKGNHPVEDAEVEPTENDERFPRHVGILPAYSWYLRHANNLQFVNCNFSAEKADGRPIIVIDNVDHILFENTSLPFSTICSSRIQIRKKSTNINLLNCKGFANRKEISVQQDNL